MSDINLTNLERISDYSIALMNEISNDIELLSKHWMNDDNNLNEINRKIDLARAEWVNVDKLDKQVQEFRISLFKRNIENKIEDLKSPDDNYLVNVTKLEKEYSELRKEKWIDIQELDDLMLDLSNELTRALIKHMIINIQKSWWTSVHSMERIAHEISKAKEKWINVGDIEEMLFGE